MAPFVRDKSKWSLKPDVMYWENWPVRQPALFFAAVAYGDQGYLDLFESLPADPTEQEVLRNVPIRQPELWVE